MSTIDTILADVKTADDLLSKVAPMLAAILPAASATGPVGMAVTISGEALVALQALVSWAEKQASVVDTLAVDAVEAAVDAAERAKFPNG